MNCAPNQAKAGRRAMPEWLKLIFEHLQWPAMVIALAGAWYVGADTPRQRWWGFWGFLFSNILWVGRAIYIHEYALLIMQALFIITSVRGLWRNRSVP